LPYYLIIMQNTINLIQKHSPYLERLIALYPDVVEVFEAGAADAQIEAWISEIYEKQTHEMSESAGRIYLRTLKQKISLLIALADIAGVWDLSKITRALSLFADSCVQFALEQIYRASIPKAQLVAGEILSKQSGIAILGMGKLGAYELNYSSDIDLIALYDPEKLSFLTEAGRNRFAVRIIQQLAGFLQDKQEGGYVFRVDLRLRPDPASTGLAVALETATAYYEKAGQNWERAAMIKARFIGGDNATGEQFLRIIQPFIWRNHLDFAAIDDILSIKRQMQAAYEPEISLISHHMKTGYGAIREIEFLAQIHQLIWGGRVRTLRLSPTCVVLDRLSDLELLSKGQVDYLKSAYQLYRLIEHRLQMKHDQQTHTMPSTEAEINELAEFCGFADSAAFKAQLLEYLNGVHEIFTLAFQDSAPLGFGGKLVFTGVDHDFETLQTLRNMGFKQPEEVSTAIQQWHKGSKRCTRTKRAREILTELVPLILAELGATASPDRAFHNFDNFLSALPVGVQPFSLFNVNRPLLSVVASIVGNAPVLAAQLSQYPQLLDVLVNREISNVEAEITLHMLDEWLKLARDQEELVNYFCSFKLEQEFRIGVDLLERKIAPQEASLLLTQLADSMIYKAVEYAAEQLKAKYKSPPSVNVAIIGLGKLGTTELMIGSDLDLMCVYDVDSEDYRDDVELLEAHQYYNRLINRIIHLLTHPTKIGNLYQLDTKLRPYGAQGAVAVKLDSFKEYYSNSAWVVEHLALMQARIVYTSESMQAKMRQALDDAKVIDVKPAQLIKHVHEVRAKISEQHFSSNPWDIKYVWGGVMDLQWILKTLIAKHTSIMPADDSVMGDLTSTTAQLKWLYERDILNDRQYQSLLEAHHLFHSTLSYLRLCHGDKLDEKNINEGLQILLCSVSGFRNFTALKQQLLRLQAQVYHIYQNLEFI
jgi:[glutamine synthetase] adenylyltransferase / [glutamine synthetase]-adenylyl-L-tyrosine phosphorylase